MKVSTMAKSVAANSIYNFLLKFFRLIMPVIVSSYVIRTLDEQLYAEFLSASTWLDLALMFGVFGVTSYGIREAARVRDDQERSRRLFSSLFSINLVTNGVVLLAYTAVVLFSMESMTRAIYLTLGLKVFANIFLVEWLNEAMENYRFITVKTILVRLIYTVLIFLFIHRPDDVVKYCVVIVATDFLNNIISFVYINRRLPISFRNLEIGRHLLPLISMLIISNVNMLYTQLDKMLLDRTVSSLALADYRIPQDITNMIANLLSSVVMVAVPRLAYYRGNGQQEEYRKLLHQGYRSFMLVVFPACMGFACLAREVIVLYTDSSAYYGAIPVLVLFAFRTIEMSVYTVCANQIFYVYNQERVLVRLLLACGLLNLLMNLLLIGTGTFTPVTAILTTILAEILLLVLMFWFTQKKLEIDFHFFTRENLRYFLLSLIFIPITAAVRALDLGEILSAVIIIPACVAVYFGALLLLRDETMWFLTRKALRMFLGRLHR